MEPKHKRTDRGVANKSLAKITFFYTKSVMKSGIVSALALSLILFTACSTPNRLVYSSGFSFANYDFVVVGKPDGDNTSTSLYGMDVEFANLMSRYNFKVIGDKEINEMPLEQRKRALFARIAMSAVGNRILLSVSFDDAVSGKTGSSITAFAKGEIFDTKKRDKAFESAAATIIRALEADKGLRIMDDSDEN